jgi:type IV secretory pathway VirB2 component (pilin)
MQVHLPEPLHGWREFAGEVGIIVLGVLIALAAQQIVEAIHGNAQAREFRRP